MELQPGTFLQDGRYQIVGVIGQGGFGITYKALQPALDRYVAIKEFFMKKLCEREGDTSRVTVPTESAREEAGVYRAKFLKEARTIASFTHPNIVRIHDIFEENNTAYYVMEFIGGGSLSAVGALPQERALGYIRQIGSALQYMHEHKTMHLDVKPGNIMLRADGTAVLIDFGISKHYDAADGETSRTPVGISKGYAPAEQYREGGVSTFSPASDVYSLAATLYKLLTGITPPESIDLQSGEAELPPYPSGVGEACRQAIACALRPRKERPQTVADFLALLDGGEKKANESTLSMPEPKPQADSKSAGGHVGKSKLYIGMGVGGVLLLAVLLVVWLNSRSDTGSASVAEELAVGPAVGLDSVDNAVALQPEVVDVATEPQKADASVAQAATRPSESSSSSSAQSPKGQGKLQQADGTYEGTIVNGKANGKGIKKFANGEVYEGEFKNDEPHGKGKWTYLTGVVYEGELKNGKRDGYGTVTFTDGEKYTGDWKNDLREGEGTLFLKNGDKYSGTFKNDAMNGHGIMIFADGAQYNGEWKNNLMDGWGVLNDPNPDKFSYTGTWKEGDVDGKGTIEFKDGKKYVGETKKGTITGTGTLYNADGSVLFSGQWNNGNPVQ